MKQKKDTRFWLTSFLEEQEQTKHEYKSFQRQIENNGCFIMKTETDTVKIYTPELAVIFTSKELPARNMDTKTETTINGWEYLKTYIEAYKEGEQYFETEFKVSPNTLYGANAEQYVRDIHLNFFHVQHTGVNEGWAYVKKQYPIILTRKAVKEFGYYSGIVNKVEEQVKKYPRLFATFDKCEHNLPPQQTETEQETIEMKPVLKPEVLQIVFEIIKDFFSTEQQPDLKQVIGTGNIASKKLIFRGNGNRLTDTFKKLIEHDFITGCQKQDLINWIILNFTFTQQNKVKPFTYDTVEKTISRNDSPCKSPLIIIKNGQIQKVEQPRTKKYNKY
jgi:hypothetical protein